MSSSQTQSFSSQRSIGQASAGENPPRRAHTKSEWVVIAGHLEGILRPYALRFGKLTEEQLAKLVTEAIARDNIDSENLLFKKGIIKARTNLSTWKHRTLGAVSSYVTRMVETDTGILKDTVDPKLLFQHFARKYSVHDAEDAFPWAARFIKFGHMLPLGSRLAPGPYWIKTYFVSLAVQTKLHHDKPREQGFDREALLGFYDQYPQLPQFAKIKPSHFGMKVLKPKHRTRAKPKLPKEALMFGSLDEGMELDDDESGDSASDKDGSTRNNESDEDDSIGIGRDFDG